MIFSWPVLLPLCQLKKRKCDGDDLKLELILFACSSEAIGTPCMGFDATLGRIL